jgi:hypothetical protein
LREADRRLGFAGTPYFRRISASEIPPVALQLARERSISSMNLGSFASRMLK